MIELQNNDCMTVQFLGENGVVYDDLWYRWQELTHYLQAMRYYEYYDLGGL